MKKILFAFIVFNSFLSCTALLNGALRSKGVFDKEIKIHKVQNEKKEIIFFPMIHMGTQEFYDDVKIKIDSFKRAGFYFFLEGLGTGELSTKDDTMKLDTLARKFRKISGKSLSFIASDGGVFDTINNEIVIRNKRYKLKEKLIKQPSFLKLGINETDGRKVDVIFSDMMDEYEKKYGQIELEECDFQTMINEKYDCEYNNSQNGKKLWDEIILDYRNHNVANEISKEKHNKIAIIYGSAHVKGILELLIKQGYREVK
ncbi:MAG: hypothetical protein WBF83_01765 [Moheibacter sp.]